MRPTPAAGLIREIDFGTPIPASEALVSLTIDGVEVSVPEGTSVMAAAMMSGTTIPKLCATDSLEPFGSCRLCLVEIEGRKGTPASCTTPAEPGMVVRTQTDRLAKLRRGVMELYISDHPLDCLTCAANGDCELQDMAGVVGLREVRYGYAGDNHFGDAKDETNPYFSYDPAKCIVCNRCVRACEEVQGTFALTISMSFFFCRISSRTNANGPRCRKLPPSASDAPSGTFATSSFRLVCLAEAPNPVFMLVPSWAMPRSGGVLQRAGALNPLTLLGRVHHLPKIAAPLYIEPEVRAVAEHAGEDQRCRRRHVPAVAA